MIHFMIALWTMIKGFAYKVAHEMRHPHTFMSRTLHHTLPAAILAISMATTLVGCDKLPTEQKVAVTEAHIIETIKSFDIICVGGAAYYYKEDRYSGVNHISVFTPVYDETGRVEVCGAAVGSGHE